MVLNNEQRGNKAVGALVDFSVYEKFKESGMKLSKIIEFGLMYGELNAYVRQLENTLKEIQAVLDRKNDIIFKFGEETKRLNAEIEDLKQQLGQYKKH